MPKRLYFFVVVIKINSIERRELRYQRRKARRDKKRLMKNNSYGNFEEVFSYPNLFKAGLKCCKGVGWKASTQNFKSQLSTNASKSCNELNNGTWKSKGFKKFTISERGKTRHISSVAIEERMVQKCLCDNLLTPVFTSAFIYDNGASMKGKGMDFSLNRLNCHLERHYRHYRTDGYVLLFDFSDFFNSAPHAPIYYELSRRISDKRINKLIGDLMENYGSVGMGLGSQLSQIEALMIPNSLDHMIKEGLKIKGYGRYMDDGYLIHHSKEYLEYCLVKIESKCKEIGLILNKKKTRIVPIKNGFIFLKTKFILTKTGRVVRRANKETGKRLKRKMKTYRKWCDIGKFTIKDAIQSFNSSKGCLLRCDSYRLLKRLEKEFTKLFTIEEFIGNERYIYVPTI